MTRVEREVRKVLDKVQPPVPEKWKQGCVIAVQAVRQGEPQTEVELLPGAALAAADVVGMFSLQDVVHLEDAERAAADHEAELASEAQRRV